MMKKREVGHPASLFLFYSKSNEHKFKTICTFARIKLDSIQYGSSKTR